MGHSPLVSIIIPVFNGGRFLAAAIDSALGQTYCNIEVIVVNDGSLDGGETRAICARYRDCIRYFEKPNGGVASAANLAIREMRGEYFCWLSHDDLHLPTKTERQLAYLEGIGSDPVILHCDGLLIDEEGRTLRPVRFDHQALEARPSTIFIHHFLHGGGMLIPRQAFARVGLFDERLTYTNDHEMWLRMSSAFPLVHQPEVLFCMRMHKAQGSRRPGGQDDRDRLWLDIVRTIEARDVPAQWPSRVAFLTDAARSLAGRPFRGLAARYAYNRCRAILDEDPSQLPERGAFIAALRRHFSGEGGASDASLPSEASAHWRFGPILLDFPGKAERALLVAIGQSRLFDPGWYAKRYGVAGSWDELLQHYLSEGARAGHDPSPYFDARFYAAQYPALAQSGENPLTHFLRTGAREGAEPNPLFSPRWYLSQQSEAENLPVNPLTHFLTADPATLKDPHPFFSGAHMRVQMAQSYDTRRLLRTYLEGKVPARIDPHPFFSNSYYAGQCAEGELVDVPPLIHYLSKGIARGADPHPLLPTAAFHPAWIAV